MRRLPMVILVAALACLSCSTYGAQTLLVASYLHNDIRAYDGTTGAFQGIFVPGHSGGPPSPGELAFGPNKNLYASSYNFSSVYEYDGQSGAFIRSYSTGLDGARGIAFRPNGTLLVASANSHEIVAFAPDGTSLGTFANTAAAPIGITFGPDGDLYAAMASTTQSAHDGQVQRFDGATGASKGTFAGGNLNNPQAITFGPNGNLYVHIQYDHDIYEFDGTTGDFQRVFVHMPYPFNPSAGVVFGPDGNLYTSNLTGGAATDGVLRFDGQSGDFIDYFVPGDGSLWSSGLVFTPVPEPAPFALAAYALAVFVVAARRRQIDRAHRACTGRRQDGPRDHQRRLFHN